MAPLATGRGGVFRHHGNGRSEDRARPRVFQMGGGDWRPGPPRATIEAPPPWRPDMPTVRDILAKKGSDVITVAPKETALRAAQLMNDRGIGGLVVIEGDRPTGIFTERDILRRVVSQGRGPPTTPGGDVETTPPIAPAPETSTDGCAAPMSAKHR